MFRALFSVAIVLLLSTIALLLYANFVHDDKSAGADTLLKPPPLPPIVQPRAEPAPIPAPQPLPPEKPVAVSPLRETKEAKPKSDPRAKPEPGPGQRTYVVESGDTLWNISKKLYGVPEHYGKIAELNRMTQRDRIRPGQVLIVPDLPMTAPVPEKTEPETTETAPSTSDETVRDEVMVDDAPRDHENLAVRRSGEAPAQDAPSDPDVMPPTLSTTAPRP